MQSQPEGPMRPDDGSNEPLATAGMATDQKGTGPRGGVSTRSTEETQGSDDERDVPTPLLSRDDSGEFRTRWEQIQVGFVDDPRRSTEEADALVADVMQRLSQIFDEKRSDLEAHWEQGSEVSTED